MRLSTSNLHNRSKPPLATDKRQHRITKRSENNQRVEIAAVALGGHSKSDVLW